MKKAYIFDLDGTLVDSMPLAWKWVLFKYLDDRNIKYPKNLIREVIALGFDGMAKYYKEHFGIEDSWEEIVADFKKNLQGLYDEVIPAKPFVEEVLKILKERGHSLNILTGSPHCFLDPCIKRLGLEKYFDNMWSGDDFPMKKDDPKIYGLVAERLGSACENCVLVDDSVVPLRAARAAGWQTVGVYEEISKEFEKEIREYSDLFVYSFKELL
jgi:HAD superfamily hydrolase (TIGR01509 family)